jgi:hypothetical protein
MNSDPEMPVTLFGIALPEVLINDIAASFDPSKTETKS